MLNYIEYLGIPAKTAIGLAGIFFTLQIIGELLEFKGKIVPEFLKIRKYFARKKKERLALSKVVDVLEEYEEMSTTIVEVKDLLREINNHYSEDNIEMRNSWIKDVNEHISNSEKRIIEQDSLMRELSDKLDKNNADTLSILIENKRNAIINFASRSVNNGHLILKEEFNRIFKIYEEYESIIKENGLTNGEVDISIQIIREAYEDNLKNHKFVEDIRGYSI